MAKKKLNPLMANLVAQGKGMKKGKLCPACGKPMGAHPANAPQYVSGEIAPGRKKLQYAMGQWDVGDSIDSQWSPREVTDDGGAVRGEKSKKKRG